MDGAVHNDPADTVSGNPPGSSGDRSCEDERLTSAWRHILVSEGSDWFWWFGDHHHTDLDHVWDLNFRRHLQEVFRSLGEPVPTEFFLPLLDVKIGVPPALPQGALAPIIDGLLGAGLDDPAAEWAAAGFLAADHPSTMQRAGGSRIREARFGWHGDRLCILVVPDRSSPLLGLEIELRINLAGGDGDLFVRMHMKEGGRVEVSCAQSPTLAAATEAAWGDVVEASLPLRVSTIMAGIEPVLVLRIGRDGMVEHVFHTAGLASLGWAKE
jgi:hypothetical protein